MRKKLTKDDFIISKPKKPGEKPLLDLVKVIDYATKNPAHCYTLWGDLSDDFRKFLLKQLVEENNE